MIIAGGTEFLSMVLLLPSLDGMLVHWNLTTPVLSSGYSVNLCIETSI